MLMAVYEEERRRVERNMLALSNLNLATSSFVGGEIQKMLAQALDRVLNVVRIPAGALCLHYGDENGPTSIVVTGMDDAFCSAIQENDLDNYAVNLVARLGGLVVFRDLARDANWAALEKEEAFQHVRKILLGQGLRTVVGISLQAKQRVFGVLLLGTPDNRNFTPPELRLLLGAGPPDRHGGGEQLSDSADRAAQRRAASLERNWPRIELHPRTRHAFRTHLFRDAPLAGRRQHVYFVLRHQEQSGALRNGSGGWRTPAKTKPRHG